MREITLDVAEARVRGAMAWMRSMGTDTELLDTEEHAGSESSEPERYREYEQAAARFGLFVHYAGAEVRSLEGEVPFYYVLLSRRERLTNDDIRRLIPGFDPIHPGGAVSVGRAN